MSLSAEERLVVRVRYKDGASSATTTHALVTRPSTVDKEVDVVRQVRTREALEARVAEVESDVAHLEAQRAEGSLPQLAFSGLSKSYLNEQTYMR